MKDYISKWHKELEIFTKIKPLLILEGNILDSYQYPEDGSTPKGTILHLPDYLHYYFKDNGYENIIFFDSMNGFYNQAEEGYLEKFAQLCQVSPENGCIKAGFKGGKPSATTMIGNALGQSEQATVIVLDFASRYISSPNHMEQNEVDSFTALLQSTMSARDVKTESAGLLKNLLILVVNKVNDLPAWFYLQNPNVKTISISAPSKEERENLVKGKNFPSFFTGPVYMAERGYFEDHPVELEKVQDKFVALTEGFSFTEMNGLRKLCKNEGISMRNLFDVVDLYKYGIRENPWKCLNRDTIAEAEQRFQKRVKGQDFAITKTLDVIKRAMTGMSGLQGSSPTRPKGVLFFAGPTGTGKTETAKALAEILFGDESCCKRFDMSEYGQSHSDQKLLGAPPGYVGYEAGGQLTNAIKENPFTILLFDEIEKAHPSVLDKFLQILEDGRMTDGQGNTVYFSEAIIIFTSNLGMYTVTETGERMANVNSAMTYLEMSVKVRESIEDYFKLQLGRPEILNRIGENIVVFDFIRPEVAETILKAQVEKIRQSLLMEKQLELNLSPSAMEILLEESRKNLGNGGRGIGNVVENLLINPLARYLFQENLFGSGSVTVESIDLEALPPTLICKGAIE